MSTRLPASARSAISVSRPATPPPAMTTWRGSFGGGSRMRPTLGPRRRPRIGVSRARPAGKLRTRRADRIPRCGAAPHVPRRDDARHRRALARLRHDAELAVHELGALAHADQAEPARGVVGVEADALV